MSEVSRPRPVPLGTLGLAEMAAKRADDPPGGPGAGLYVYCVVPASGEVGMGERGLEGCPVSLVAAGGLGALVHSCPPEPYGAKNADAVPAWGLAHHRVVDGAWRRWGTVLPMTFNTIVAGQDEAEARERLRAWLAAERASLGERLERFRDKAEYGVQVFWDARVIGRQVMAANQEMVELDGKVRAASRGLAYMHRQQLERLLKAGLEARAREEFGELLWCVDKVAEAVHIGQTRTGEGDMEMLANLSCLLALGALPSLEAGMAQFREREGFAARLAGPFPPYSFC